MNKISIFLRNNLILVLVLAIYSVLGIFFLKYGQYVLNADGISYISIAQKYVAGDFVDAVNGYWGPLFSWLLVPFLFFGSSPSSALYSTKILSIIIGFFIIIGIRLLSYRFEMDEPVRKVILLSLIPIVLYFSLALISPDILVTCILIYYLYFIFNSKYSDKLSNGCLCGLIGVLAYLSKSFALPFFIIHFLLMNYVHYFQSVTRKRKMMVLKNLFLGLLIFFSISGIWIFMISDKYDMLTIGTAAGYNYALAGPESHGPHEHPFYHQGLLKPPNNSAVSAWEDPTYFKMESWSPFQSGENFKYQLGLIYGNIVKTIILFESFSLISIILIIGSVLFIIAPSYVKVKKEKLIYLLFTIILYSELYSFIYVAERYLWLVYILLMLMGGYLLSILYKKGLLNNMVKNVFLVFLAFSFIISPVNYLIINFNTYQDVYNLSERLKNDYGIHGKIASNDEWVDSVYLTYYLDGKYYGTTKNTTNYNELKNELEKNNIDYYFVWQESDNESQFLSASYREITGGRFRDLKIYSLKI